MFEPEYDEDIAKEHEDGVHDDEHVSMSGYCSLCFDMVDTMVEQYRERVKMGEA